MVWVEVTIWKFGVKITFALHNVSSARSYTLDIQGNNFQCASVATTTASKTGQKIVNLKNIFTKVII